MYGYAHQLTHLRTEIFLAFASAQSAQPDVAHLVQTARDFSGEMEHQSVLNGQNHAQIAPDGRIWVECRVQGALCLSTLDQLAKKEALPPCHQIFIFCSAWF